jgi:hypothetical protein
MGSIIIIRHTSKYGSRANSNHREAKLRTNSSRAALDEHSAYS